MRFDDMKFGGMRFGRRSFLRGSAMAAAAAGLGVLPAGLARAQQKQLTIAVFTKNVTNPFWRSVRMGAEKAGKALGVTVVQVAPTKPDNIEEQTRLVEDWIVKKPDAFVFCPVDYKALVPSIQKANKAGIPIINYNNRMTDIEKVTFLGLDDEAMGYNISKVLFTTLGGKGKIVQIEGVPGASTAQARKRGFEKAVKEFPGIEVVASQPGQYVRLTAMQVFENLMQRFPAIDGVVAHNDDMAVGVIDALDSAGRSGQTKVVGIDGIPDGLAAIAAGKMLASCDTQAHDQGYISTTAAVKFLQGVKIPPEIFLPVRTIDKSNVAKYQVKIEDLPAPDWDRIVAAQKV